MTRVCIGLGSNINPRTNLIAAADLLRKEWPHIRFSSVWQSKAVGHGDQPDFLNAVAAFDADRDPVSVFGKLRQIEEALGKHVEFRFGPRTIDLDLLLYDDETIKDPMLVVPHARMHERMFVLKPLCELIDPSERHPVTKRMWGDYLVETEAQECRKLGMEL